MNSGVLLGPRLREARKLLGLSQTAFAKESGLYQADISDMERLPKPHIAVAYIAYLYRKGIDLHTLFGEGPVALRAPPGQTRTEQRLTMAAEQAAQFSPPALLQFQKQMEALERRIKDMERKERKG